jgi:cytochrome oxidase Cu insertion factor (SCO1/SenC/PrrC family)
MNDTNNETVKKNPYTLWFVVLAFVAPAVLAYVMYFFGDIRSFSNHGEILDPVVDIAALQLKDDKNEVIPRKTITYKWRMISFVGASCDEACNARLYDSRQIHKALGKDQHRVLRMIVHLEPTTVELQQLIEREHPDAINVNGDAQAIMGALGKSAGLKDNVIYIMDPIGNVMMRFTLQQSKKDILTDLRKLLKVSQIG